MRSARLRAVHHSRDGDASGSDLLSAGNCSLASPSSCPAGPTTAWLRRPRHPMPVRSDRVREGRGMLDLERLRQTSGRLEPRRVAHHVSTTRFTVAVRCAALTCANTPAVDIPANRPRTWPRARSGSCSARPAHSEPRHFFRLPGRHGIRLDRRAHVQRPSTGCRARALPDFLRFNWCPAPRRPATRTNLDIHSS